MNREEMEAKANEYYPVPEDNNSAIHKQHCYARQGFILGATLEKEETEKLPKVRCWAARDKYGLEIYTQKPEMEHGMYSCDGDSFFLDNDEIFPELKAGDEPVEIEIFIRKL